jgi:hypothetical protein
MKPNDVSTIFSNIGLCLCFFFIYSLTFRSGFHIRFATIRSETIVNVHKELLKEFRVRVENWSSTENIGDVFVKMAPFLKGLHLRANATAIKKLIHRFSSLIVYTSYCETFEASANLLKKLKKSSELMSFLKKAKEDHRGQGNLELEVQQLNGEKKKPKNENESNSCFIFPFFFWLGLSHHAHSTCSSL